MKDEFKKTKTLKDKNLLIAMMYQPWELCDDASTEWSAANKITLTAKNTLRTVAPSTCTLTEYDSCVTFHKLYTQPFHPLNDTKPTPKSEYYSGIVAKRESVSRCSSEFRKKVSSKNKNAGKKHGLSRLKSTFLFVHDPMVLFCFQNSSLIIR